MKTLILDNYDSFTYNLFQYLSVLNADPLVVRNDAIDVAGILALGVDRIVISPGPGSPDDPAYFGICSRVILELGDRIPILGVCLGHQGIIHAYGGRVVRAAKPMHGKTSVIHHTDQGVFRALPRRFEAMRYHSLVGEPSSIPPCLLVTAHTADGVIMGVQHRDRPTHGVQFHPESIGTPLGQVLLNNFLTRPFDPPV